MICELCNKEVKIIKFFHPSFDKHKWFFAYYNCECGDFIIQKEMLEEKEKRLEEKRLEVIE